MKEAYRILKPGVGWIQCCEFNPNFKCDDGSVPPTAATLKVVLEAGISNSKFRETTRKLLETKSDRMLHGEHLEKTLADAGFVDITVKKAKITNGDWDGGLSSAMQF